MPDNQRMDQAYNAFYAAVGVGFTIISIISLCAILMIKSRADAVPDVNAVAGGISGMNSSSGQNDYLQVVNTASYSWSAGSSWTIAKQAEPPVLNLKKGKKGTVKYTITATKGSDSTKYVVEGMVCVKNTHTAPTEGLAIENEIQAQDYPNQAYYTYVKADVDTSLKPVLQPGEEYCYPYSKSFEPELKLKYRDHVLVMISTSVPASDAPCPKPFFCSAAVEADVELGCPEGDAQAQVSSITVDDVPLDFDGSANEDCENQYCFQWPGNRYGEPREHERHCFKWKGHHYGVDMNKGMEKKGILYKIQALGSGFGKGDKKDGRCEQDAEPQRSWQFTESGSKTYAQTFECAKDSGVHVNTAYIRGTDQRAEAQVTVNCVK